MSAIDWQRCVPVLETTDGHRVVPSSAYLAEGHLLHGYATTVHNAEGATVTQSFVLGDDALYREAGYAALSRGREANTLYVVGRLDPRVEVRHSPEVEADPFDEALASLGRLEAKTLARDEYKHDWAPRWEWDRQRNTHDGPPDVTEQLAAIIQRKEQALEELDDVEFWLVEHEEHVASLDAWLTAPGVRERQAAAAQLAWMRRRYETGRGIVSTGSRRTNAISSGTKASMTAGRRRVRPNSCGCASSITWSPDAGEHHSSGMYPRSPRASRSNMTRESISAGDLTVTEPNQKEMGSPPRGPSSPSLVDEFMLALKAPSTSRESERPTVTLDGAAA